MKKLTTSVLAVVLTSSFSLVNAQVDTTRTQDIEAVVVTALGIKREKKALGYATQGVSGEDMADKPVTNFASALQGEVAGLNIQSYGTMGGSSNMVVRGYSSISGNNQALVVIDGVPVINSTSSTANQRTGRGGYDFGNAATDLNPDDIESVNVLKGSAATALYGSRAGQGAIIITTKKGKKRGIGVTFNSSAMYSTVDKETLPKYQTRYGAGYGPYYDTPWFSLIDFNNDGTADDLAVPFTEDASYGAAFDPNLSVYTWESIYPQLATYGQKQPWRAALNDANKIWKGGATYSNSVAFGGASDNSTFRLSYTNFLQQGNLPNSDIKRNTLSFNGSHNLTDRLSANAGVTYTNTRAKGRYGTGYDSNNIMQSMRQWWQTNTDIYSQRDAYMRTKQNITWNPNSHTNLAPIYSDNPYWTLYENFETDQRDRFLINGSLDYQLTDWLSVMGRVTRDFFTEGVQERTAIGSSNLSSYVERNRKMSETNYDLMLSVDKRLSDKLHLDGNVGWNLRVEKLDALSQATNGGLVFPHLYTITNSKNPLTAANIAPVNYTKKVDGVYARASLGIDDTYFIEGTARQDRSSALPIDNNTYFYPSVSASVVFSNLINADWLTFGKLRANWAKTGNDTSPYQVFTTYGVGASFNGAATASNNATFNNAELKPEFLSGPEVGIEMQMFKRRFGFDVTWYSRKTENLITAIDVSSASGASRVWLNAGDLLNEGVEAFVNITPIKTNNFTWDMKLNWATNRSEVTKIMDGIDFIQQAAVQGGVSIGAALGEPYGVIRGRNYVYHEGTGEKVILPNGRYARTALSNEVIGDINPDWTGGIKNSFRYKNLGLSFLIDAKKGGDVFSLDTYYGYATGLYDFTAGDNDLGNPIRNTLANGGGLILDGVQADGTKNTVRADFSTYANPIGYAYAPQAHHVYDASFVKLREASLSYDLPKTFVDSLGLNAFTLSLIGRNLWIIHKNTPYSDPEAGLGSGNIQGYQSGAYPAVKEIGASLKIEF